jgi:fructose-1,6-bisphosphatase/inositol monophosphatase family enzyme
VNYFYGIPHFCISIALRLHKQIVVGVIYDPIRGEMWTGQRGDVSKLNGAPIHVSDRAEQRVGNRVRKNVGVGMSLQAARVVNLDAA